LSEFVLDCSIALAWCFPDEKSKDGERILDLLNASSARVPCIWPLELTNALLVAERRTRITQADSARFLSLVRVLPIEIDTDLSDAAMDRVAALARGHGLSSYDASYLELAARAGTGIATLDDKLATAASALGIPVL
jgi:predicted nucleic acid-binding protein